MTIFLVGPRVIDLHARAHGSLVHKRFQQKKKWMIYLQMRKGNNPAITTQVIRIYSIMETLISKDQLAE